MACTRAAVVAAGTTTERFEPEPAAGSGHRAAMVALGGAHERQRLALRTVAQRLGPRRERGLAQAVGDAPRPSPTTRRAP